jgi:hypothetical protein
MTADPTLSTLPGVREAAEGMAREWHDALLAVMPDDDAGEVHCEWDDEAHGYRSSVIAAHLRLLCDLTRPASRDWWSRWFVAHLLDSSWGTVEGVACHMSWRGYLEVHVWTTKLSGRALEIPVGSRFTTCLPASFEAFEARCRTHGRPDFAIHTPSEPAGIPEALAAACLAVGGSNG